jgi:alkylhydroperoxidase family enzyme
MSAETPDPAFDVAAREAMIVGRPARVAPLENHEIGEEARAAANGVRVAAGSPPAEDLPVHVRTMLRHPELYRRHVELAMVFYTKTAFSPRERELVILRTAWLCKAPFEWGEHVEIGKKAGLTREEIERITAGSAAPGWSEGDRVLLRATEELRADAMITDETWAALARTCSEEQLVELPMLVGQYVKVAFFQNALRIPLLPGNGGLNSR